jgi:hypothetical protein
MQREELLQFIWKAGLLQDHPLETACGKKVLVIRPGEQNFNAGPDFFNARIRIGPTVWAGNVEVHCRASDWEKHGHHQDPAYNNVILHVVLENDRPAFNSLDRMICTLVVHCPSKLLSLFRSLNGNENWLSCQSYIKEVSEVHLRLWLTKLQSERLEEKTRRITGLLDRKGQDWEEALYLGLASGFGLPINVLPFEMTASGLPYRLVTRFRDSLADLEALLFGQAGFLPPGNTSGPYASDLFRRYMHHRPSLPGEPVSQHLWKLLRLRPASFPAIRLSQFASLIHRRFPLVEPILEARSLAEIEQLLKVRASEYWNTHYQFGKCSPDFEKYVGHQSILSLIINSIVPFLFAYAQRKNHMGAVIRGTSIMQELEAESNQIIKKWAKFGIKPKGAFESQALIQLHNAYCKQKRCLDCLIGTEMIRSGAYEKK